MKKIPFESTDIFRQRTLDTNKLRIGVLFDETINPHDSEP